MNILALIAILILLMLIYMKVNFKNINVQNKLMKIVCKLSLSKDSQILVIKIMENYYLCSSNQNEFKIIENLDRDQVIKYLSPKDNTLLKKE